MTAKNSVNPPAISPDDAEPTRWLDQAHPTPKFGDQGFCTIGSSLRIAASPKTCLAIVLHAPGYSSPSVWNNWVRDIKITSRADAKPSADIPAELSGPDYLACGVRFEMSVVMDQTSTSSPRVQAMDLTACEAIDEPDGRKGFRVGWTYCMPVGLRCERVQEFVEDGEGGTMYTTWETFGGILARAVWWTSSSGVKRGFTEWGRGLKEKAESMA